MFEKNKKIFCIMIAALILIYGTNFINAETLIKEPYIDAKCAIAMDAETKTVMYEKNSSMIVPMASTTKIITALVAIKYGNFNKKVEISSKAANIKGSTVGYKKGETITINELLYGLMLRSGNDAAIALSEGVAGSSDNFVKLMNEYAAEIGIVNTHFKTPHGLDDDEHYSTAYDLALATSEARKCSKFNGIVASKDIDASLYGFTRSYHNINKILWQIPQATGVKTGYTGNAGKCLVTSLSVKGHDVIIVVLNCTPRWRETRKIYDYILSAFDYKKVCSEGENAKEIMINDTKVRLAFKEDITIPIKNGSSYEIKIAAPKRITQDIKKGDSIGKITIYSDGKNIYSQSLVSKDNVSVKKRFKWLNMLKFKKH